MKRVYKREQGGSRRYYGDFRDYADQGGGREALCVPGEKRATSDKALAETLAAQRLAELQRKRAESQGRAVAGLPPLTTLESWASDHLVAKAKAGKVTDQWMDGEELRLNRAVAHFGKARQIAVMTIGVVVALLRAAELVAAEHHRHPLRQQQRR